MCVCPLHPLDGFLHRRYTRLNVGLSLAPRIGEIVCGYRLLRALGSRAWPRYVATKAREASKRSPRVVVELFAESADVVQSARALTQLRHAKLVPVRDVVVEAGVVAVESDFVEGEWLADLLEARQRLPTPTLGALLRVLADVLEGLSAFHGLAGPSGVPLHLVHGEVAPANILVGADGVARLAHPVRAPAADPAPDVIGYLAPEVLLHDQSADERADVYSAGVLLWEALTGRRLHSATHAGEIVVRLLGGKVQLAEVPRDSLWAQPLAEAAKRALSPELGARYASAAEMTAAVRWMSGEHLGSKQDVVGLVESLAGARIRARAGGGAWGTQAPVAPAAVAKPSIPTAGAQLAQGAPPASVRGDAPTPVPPRTWPAPPPAVDPVGEVRADDDAEPISLEPEAASDRPTALPGLPAGARVVPKAPPLPRLSVPTPIVPISMASFARASTPSPSQPDLPLVPPAPPAPPALPEPPEPPVVLAPLPSEPPVPEGTDAPLVLPPLNDSEAPVARPRRKKLLAVAATAAVALVLGLAWLANGTSGAPEVAKQPDESARPASAAVPVTTRAEVAEPPKAPIPSASQPAPSVASPSVVAADAPSPPTTEPPPSKPSTAPAPAAPPPPEAASPPPLRKKSKTAYYPLGI